ncbi:hypothetical protein H2204_002433 [Knufia peltigerae]|uniref:Zn(2)-C6 fungal-type domain-containing protein n=1 Tax=Knufia peltigerae TaxID=1002370 RepID=A0AA38YD08_9EURO|nr:hypothetical protein H2204_002433 [Knufia peltigerae]
MTNRFMSNLDLIARRKSTMACEECRRRKAKCNGFQPCDHCAAYSIACIYDTRRQRRGPKPKSQPQKSSSNQAADRPSPTVDVRNGSRTPDTADSPRREPRVPKLPIVQDWHDDLKACLTSLEGRCPDAGDVDLICHLIELFYTYVYVQQTPPWSVEDFFAKLKSGKKAIARLCLAMAAASNKYLVHSAANSASEGCKGDEYAHQARISLLEMVDGDLMERAQTLCTLSIYEMHRANGVQAWSDIELARSYIQILNTTHSDISTITEALTLAGDFIRTIGLMQTMGNLRLSCNSLQHQKALSAPVEGRTRLISLLELFAHIQSFAQSCLGPECHAHWLLDSPYRRLQSKLDEYALQQTDVFNLSQESLQKSIDSGNIDQIHCTLMWHICVLVLNRGFLPIRGQSDHGASDTTPIPYPAAPIHFLKEKENVCEACASTISTICNEVVIRELFFPTVLIGYCCYQSSLILLNNIGGPRSNSANRAIQDLRVNFAILGAIRHSYLPAEDWIENLSRIQRLKPSHMQNASKHCFDNYFARFPDLEEPPLVAFSSHSSLKQRTKAPPKPEAVQPRDESNVWKDLYSQKLNEQMAAFGALELSMSTSSALPKQQQENRDNSSSSTFQAVRDGASKSAPHVPVEVEQEIPNIAREYILDTNGVAPAPSLGLPIFPQLLHGDFTSSSGGNDPNDISVQQSAVTPSRDMDFTDEFDVGAMLLQHLHSGELWPETYSTQQLGLDDTHWRPSMYDQLA